MALREIWLWVDGSASYIDPMKKMGFKTNLASCGLILISGLIFGVKAGAETGPLDRESMLYSSTQLLSAPAGYPVVNGEVRKVDLSAMKVTIRHEEIPNLDMPPMTMVFKAATREMLESLVAGAKIQFVAESINGQMTVLWLEVL